MASRMIFPTLGCGIGTCGQVASNFYGLPGGVATNVAHVDNYDANYFITEQSLIDTSYTASLPSNI